MQKIIVLPAIFIGCMVVIWVGTMAAASMPSQELLAPTLTAAANFASANISDDRTGDAADANKSRATSAQSCTLAASYPPEIQQWCSQIESAAHDTNLPVNLIAAVMLQESGGDPLVISSSGAVGLMQVMPRDGIAADFMCINGPCFSSRPTINELQDPAFNVTYGSQMLAGLYAKHGSYREALFRYGPMNIGYHYADLVLKIWESYI